MGGTDWSDQLAAEVFPYIDLIAERATALGGVAM
jgi:DNA-binding ferritin-like protein